MDSNTFDNEVVCRVIYAYVKGNGPEPYSPAVAELTCLVLDLVKAERIRSAVGPEEDEVKRAFDALVDSAREKVRLSSRRPNARQ